VGSNPTPRAYLVDLYNNIKSNKKEVSLRKSKLSFKQEHQEYQNESNYNALERKIDYITKSCSKTYFNKILKNIAEENEENADIICDYVIAEETEINIKNSTKEGRIKVLVWVSKFYDNKKSLRQMTKQDILGYLNNLRKPVANDQTQRWIGSYNGRQIILNKFFRWLYNPNEPDQRKRETPDCMKGIKQLPRKEKTPYSPSDL
jgi:hypothetical protein